MSHINEKKVFDKNKKKSFDFDQHFNESDLAMVALDLQLEKIDKMRIDVNKAFKRIETV